MKFDVLAKKTENLVIEFPLYCFEEYIDNEFLFTIEEMYSENVVVKDFQYELSEKKEDLLYTSLDSRRFYRKLMIIVEKKVIENLKYSTYHYDLISKGKNGIRFRLFDGLIKFTE